MDPHRPESFAPGHRTDPDAPELEAARAAFPEWDITRNWYGYQAVPRGTTVIQSMFLGSLLEKLRDRPTPRARSRHRT
jgi:hypothetical protein